MASWTELVMVAFMVAFIVTDMVTVMATDEAAPLVATAGAMGYHMWLR